MINNAIIYIVIIILLSACSSKTLSVKDLVKSDERLVYDVQLDNFKQNYRLKIFAGNPKSVVYWGEGNNLVISIDGITDKADEILSSVVEFPCSYREKKVGTRLNYYFKCESKVAIYPEYGKNYLDLIIKSN